MIELRLREKTSVLLVTRRSDWCINLRSHVNRSPLRSGLRPRNDTIPFSRITWLLMALEQNITVQCVTQESGVIEYTWIVFEHLLPIFDLSQIQISFWGHMRPLTQHAHWRGGGKKCPPSGFSQIAEKRRRAAPPFLQNLLRIELDTLCKNFNPRSLKVRSPGQVKVKNGFLNLRLRSGHTRYPIGFKPSVFHKITDTYNLYVSDFWYLWPEVRSISWPHHYKSMGKNSHRSYWKIMRQNHLNHS